MSRHSLHLAIVGATGLVGESMLTVIKEQSFPFSKLSLYASERSAGKQKVFQGQTYTIRSSSEILNDPPDIALFSAGSKVSINIAESLANKGTWVIDNSSAWRMDSRVALVVPEVNLQSINDSFRIIANPNCSTIQLVIALAPLHKLAQIKRMVISTYQSVSGSGIKAIRQLEAEEQGLAHDPVYPHPIHHNCIPHCDIFLDNAYTKEEMKLVHETRKILDDTSIGITATAVRVPVLGGHSESVNVTFENAITESEIRNALQRAEGVKLLDNPASHQYPMPYLSHHSDWVYVGRIRKDESLENSFNFWIVSDNIRKGAATNAVQIAQQLLERI